MSMAMVLAMLPMLTQPAHAKQSDIELAGGSYTLKADNYLVNDVNQDDVARTHHSLDVIFRGDTVINLNGYALESNSIKSGFNNSVANEHPWYTYDLTIDGRGKGGSIRIGSSYTDDYALAANNLTIRNLDENSSVYCDVTTNKAAISAQNDLRIENIKKDLSIMGVYGTLAHDGETKISDVSGRFYVQAKRNGISAANGNDNGIDISRSNVDIDIDHRDGSGIRPGYKSSISITESSVYINNGNDSDPEDSAGGYNALRVDGTVEIKDSFFVAVNAQKDHPAMIVYNPGKLIVSGESMVGCEIFKGGNTSALMAADIELRDGNRLFQPKDGYIGTVTYNNKSYKGVLKKDGSAAESVGFGSGKELVHTIAAPSKVFTNSPIHMSGVLKDEDGNPVRNAMIEIMSKNNWMVEHVSTDARGMWKYEGNSFEFEEPGEVTFEIWVMIPDNEEMGLQNMLYYLPMESQELNVQVVNEGHVETLEGLELSDPPEGKNRKTEYKCGEKFDLSAAYIKVIIIAESATGESAKEELDLNPSKTTVSPATLKHGMDTVTISYSFEGRTASIDYPVTVEHNWDSGKVTKNASATSTGVKTYTCTGCKATKTEEIKKLTKKANTLNVKAKTATIKFSKLKKKTQALSRAKVIAVVSPQGKLTYKKASVAYAKAKSVRMSKKTLKKYKKQAAAKILINANTGKVTMKKGLKKGTYKVKVKVKAAGNANYNASAWKIVTFTVKVK